MDRYIPDDEPDKEEEDEYDYAWEMQEQAFKSIVKEEASIRKVKSSKGRMG